MDAESQTLVWTIGLLPTVTGAAACVPSFPRSARKGRWMVGPTNPALAVHLAAAAEEMVFDGQAVHVLDPVTAEYVPAAQFTQIAEEGAPKAVEYMPAEQLAHTVATVIPSPVEYLPATHLVHTRFG